MKDPALAHRLTLVREVLGRNKIEMSSLIGQHRRTWAGYEAGSHIPGGDVFQRLVELGFSGDWLLTGQGSMYPESFATGQQPAEPIQSAPATGPTIDQELHALVVDGILLIYKQENARLPPRDLGRLAASIHNDLIQTYADPDERKIGLKMALKQLQHALNTPITAATINKQQA